MNLKKSASVISIISLLFFSTKVMSAEECFENISRSIFKFNMGVDNAIIEPLAKGYNKLPDPIKKVQVILHQIFQLYYQYQILYFKVI